MVAIDYGMTSARAAALQWPHAWPLGTLRKMIAASMKQDAVRPLLVFNGLQIKRLERPRIFNQAAQDRPGMEELPPVEQAKKEGISQPRDREIDFLAGSYTLVTHKEVLAAAVAQTCQQQMMSGLMVPKDDDNGREVRCCPWGR